MPSSCSKAVRFIALVPHRDGAAPLMAHKARLFAAGAFGAYSFPPAAPLEAVSRAFSLGELKGLARSIREANDTIRFGLPVIRSYPPFTFWGPELEMAMPRIEGDMVLWRSEPPVWCAALVPGGEAGFFPSPPAGSFRAAMIANLIIRPLGQGAIDYSFEWKLGRPVWLPRPSRPPRGL